MSLGRGYIERDSREDRSLRGDRCRNLFTPASEVDTMVIVGICRGPGATLDADNSNCTFRFNEVIDDDVNIGGKVTLSASANPPVLMLKP